VARFIGSANLIAVTVERAGDGVASVLLPGGRRAEAPTSGRSFSGGDSALLMVRPERIRLSTVEPAANAMSLPVTCRDLVYQGAQVRCALADADGAELVAQLETDEPRHGVTPGAALWASWNSMAARLLPRDG
jgi:spermidine/putrescine transport system ATP-binding protein